MDGMLLRRWMRKRGVTQKQLAQVVGISRESMNAKINGRYTFSVEEAAMICDCLHITEARERAHIFLHHASQKWDGGEVQCKRA